MSENAIQLRPPRLPYIAQIEERFGVDKATWKVLVEAVWPEAGSVESVAMALAYCKARQLDPLKRVVHIVPVWNNKKKAVVDTVWPGIGELRTTAFRTKSYAGQAPAEYGPDVTKQWGEIKITFPEWAQVSVYRIVGGLRCEFAGHRVYWLEEFAEKKGGAPNSMWTKRPRGQITKVAEAAALRLAFPEELGDEPTAAEGPVIVQEGHNGFTAHELEEGIRTQTLLDGANDDGAEGNDVGLVPEPQADGQPADAHGDSDDQRRDVRDGRVDQGGAQGPVSGGQAPAETERPDEPGDGTEPVEPLFMCLECLTLTDEYNEKKIKGEHKRQCKKCLKFTVEPYDEDVWMAAVAKQESA